jgi:hypothetical protein
MQKGLRERLLCKRCEGELSKYETYSAQVLRRIKEQFSRDGDWVVIEHVDFVMFRLFALSLIWRAHTTALHMFRAVKLGPHADSIRHILLRKDPGELHHYGFALAKIAGLESHGEMIVAPRRRRYEGLHSYEFMAFGFIWVFIVSKDSDKLVGRFPFVGGECCLTIPVVHLNKQKLFTRLRRAFGLNRQRG